MATVLAEVASEAKLQKNNRKSSKKTGTPG